MSTAPGPPPASPAILRSARLWVLLAALLWSLGGVMAKAPVFADWPADERGLRIAFWRTLFAGVAILPWVRAPRWNARLVPMGLAFAGMNASYMSSMALTTAANAIWLQSTAPLWVFLGGALLLHEPIVRRDLVPLAAGLAGIAVILGCEWDAPSWWGIVLGLVAGICYAGVILALRTLRHENGPFLVAVNHLTAAALLLPFAAARGAWPTPAQLAVLAAFGVLQMSLPYLVLARGLKTVPSQEAALLALVEPVLNPLWVWLVWRSEVPAWWTLVGGGLILAGLLWRFGQRLE